MASNEKTNVDVSALVEELGIKNEDKQALIDKANKASEAYESAKKRLESANEALARADEQPNVVAEAVKYGETLAKLDLEEKVIKSTLRTKFGGKRSTKTDDGDAITDEAKTNMRRVIDDSGHDGFTVSKLAEEFSVKRTHVAAWVKELVEAGEVVQVGIKRATKYYLADMQPAEEAAA